MNVILRFAGLLVLSNAFMTLAWYGHLRYLRMDSWILAVLVSWGLAFFEYVLQVPANRLAYGTLTLDQLKIMQEVITLSVFVPFAVLFMGQPIRMNFVRAGVCMVGAVYFIFKT